IVHNVARPSSVLPRVVDPLLSRGSCTLLSPSLVYCVAGVLKTPNIRFYDGRSGSYHNGIQNVANAVPGMYHTIGLVLSHAPLQRRQAAADAGARASALGCYATMLT